MQTGVDARGRRPSSLGQEKGMWCSVSASPSRARDHSVVQTVDAGRERGIVFVVRVVLRMPAM